MFVIDFTEKQLNEIQSYARERTVRTQAVECGLETLIKRIDDEVIKLDLVLRMV